MTLASIMNVVTALRDETVEDVILGRGADPSELTIVCRTGKRVRIAALADTRTPPASLYLLAEVTRQGPAA